MYSLPITTYSDYWRATKTWSSYLGGLAVFAASTHYSTLGAHDLSNTQPPLPKVPQVVSSTGFSKEISFLESRQKAISASQESLKEISRGFQGALQQSNRAREGQKPLSSPAALEVEETVKTPIQGSGKLIEQTEIVKKEIPFETQYVESDKVPPGMSQVQEEGESGILQQVVKTYELEGQPVDQKIQVSYPVKVPKKKVIIQNTKPIVGERFDLSNIKVSRSLTVESTAYTYTGSKTATGIDPRQGLIAVDPKVIALGSKVYVEGYGYAIAADTGGAIHGNKIDVFFPNLRKCLDWGRRPVKIHVLSGK